MEKCPTMLTIRETANRTGMAYSAIRTLCIQNRIVHIRIGNKYLVNYEKLVSYLNGERSSKEPFGNLELRMM